MAAFTPLYKYTAMFIELCPNLLKVVSSIFYILPKERISKIVKIVFYSLHKALFTLQIFNFS